MKIILQIIGALDVEQTWKISFSNYCAKGVSWAKNCKFLWKIVLKKFSNKKTTNKIFSKTFPRGIKCWTNVWKRFIFDKSKKLTANKLTASNLKNRCCGKVRIFERKRKEFFFLNHMFNEFFYFFYRKFLNISGCFEIGM